MSVRSARIAHELRVAIAEGRFAPGDRLPAEPELAERLGVSRTTLREAMRALAEEGYVRRLPGAGTTVTNRPLMRNTLERNFGVSHLIETFGLEAATLDRELATEPADAETAVALELEPGDPVVVLRRVRTAGGRPVVYSIDRCPAEVLADPPDELGSIYETLHECGIEVHHGIARLRPWSADAEMAALLHTARGALLMEISQVDYTEGEAPVLWSHEYHLADAFEISVYRRGPAAWER
jgi:GntR family transcriptional regulator